jgi:two-component system chemotaxis sensor kinase CheA
MVVCGPCKGDTQTRFFVRHGATVPLVELAKLLRVPTASGGRQALVVRRSREEPLAFAVERVLGQQETVVRPLDDPLVNVSGISGATDLGDGRATLVLDLVTLSARLEQAEAA